MEWQAERPELVLASASPARAEMLRAAGLVFRTVPVAVDEAALKHAARARGSDAAQTALALAAAKAAAAGKAEPAVLVIGADQLLACEGEWFDKPGDGAAAAAQLRRLCGKRHTLFSAVCCWRKGKLRWSAVGQARLRMRRFSEAFLHHYLACEGDAVRGSVGAYRIEGVGVQLFAAISGEASVIRGLPLLPLLAYLRRAGVLQR